MVVPFAIYGDAKSYGAGSSLIYFIFTQGSANSSSHKRGHGVNTVGDTMIPQTNTKSHNGDTKREVSESLRMTKGAESSALIAFCNLMCGDRVRSDYSELLRAESQYH